MSTHQKIDVFGQPAVSEAARRRKQAQHRADLVDFLGWKPEVGKDRYAACTGELLKWAREAGYCAHESISTADGHGAYCAYCGDTLA